DQFHTRFLIDRPAVILYQRTSGQYELIMTGEVDKNKVEDPEYSFGEDVGDVLYKLIQATNTVYHIQVDPKFTALEDPVKRITTGEFEQPLLYYRKNPFVTLHPEEIIPDGAEILGQYIDKAGKGRGVQFTMTVNGEDYEASIILPPFQPL